jgi:hypothetical protein
VDRNDDRSEGLFQEFMRIIGSGTTFRGNEQLDVYADVNAKKRVGRAIEDGNIKMI